MTHRYCHTRGSDSPFDKQRARINSPRYALPETRLIYLEWRVSPDRSSKASQRVLRFVDFQAGTRFDRIRVVLRYWSDEVTNRRLYAGGIQGISRRRERSGPKWYKA